MKSLIFFLVLFAFLLFGTNNILACSCLPAKGVAQELEQSNAVFSGKVIKIKSHRQAENIFASVEVIFNVQKAWKGVKKKTISVFTSSNSAACGYSFRKNQTYLVYANGNDEGKLSTSICSRTKSLKDAREDLRELGAVRGIAEYLPTRIWYFAFCA
jgi:hypothetical protein